METSIIVDDYTKKYMPELLGKTLVPKYWHAEHEDAIWVDCLEDPKLSGYVFYLSLKNWKID